MKLLLGVCGSIAAYKAAELVRLFQDHGASVEVAMTASAERFITPLTLTALTGRRVYTSLWNSASEQDTEGPIDHIAVAQAIDALLVAPATATTLARLAHGIADDFLTAVALATKAPVLLAPAMNVNMWQHPVTQANVHLLQKRSVTIIPPDAGYLACGLTGSGRLADLQTITDATLAAVKHHTDLGAETILITAGGTREALDPVRFLGNRSSGRMGHALAEAAVTRGARVILITASMLSTPVGCDVVLVESAADMAQALERHLSSATLVFGAAAVADFRPSSPSSAKLRRNGPLTLELEPTPDLMAYAAAHRRSNAIVVAFAAETENLEQNARLKLQRKGVDAIVANNVAKPGVGFDAEENEGLFLTSQAVTELPRTSKRQMADQILDKTLQLLPKGERGKAPLSHIATKASGADLSREPLVRQK